MKLVAGSTMGQSCPQEVEVYVTCSQVPHLDMQALSHDNQNGERDRKGGTFSREAIRRDSGIGLPLICR